MNSSVVRSANFVMPWVAEPVSIALRSSMILRFWMKMLKRSDSSFSEAYDLEYSVLKLSKRYLSIFWGVKKGHGEKINEGNM